MKFSVLLCLFLSEIWNAASDDNKPVPVQRFTNDGVINMEEDQNLTIFVNTEPFEIIPDGELSVIKLTPEMSQKIERHWLNGDTTVTLATYIHIPVSVEYDWLGQNIYWLQQNLIEVADINGKFRKTLYKVHGGNDLAIDPSTATLVSLLVGVPPGIETADMDGIESSRKIIVTGSSFVTAGSMAVILDTEKGMVYWSDKILRRIQRCLYDGSKLELVAQFAEDIAPTAIDIYEDTIYWIQYNALTVNKMSLSLGSSKSIAKLPESIVMYQMSLYAGFTFNYTTYKIHMKLFDPKAKMNKDRNDSLLLKQNCSQLSLPSKQSPGLRCVCGGTEYYLADDDTCQRHEDITMVVVTEEDNKFFLVDNRTEEILNKDFSISILDMDFGETDDDLIFCAMIFNLYRSTITNFTQGLKPIDPTLLMSIYLVAFDWISKNIYIAAPLWSFDSTTIMVLGGNKFLQLIDSFDGRTNDLSLDCYTGLVFFTRPIEGEVAKRGMDGSVYGKYILTSTNGGRSYGLALDLEEQKVYWILISYSNWLTQMWRCSYTGMDKEEIIRLRLFIYEMFIFGNFLFVAELSFTGEAMISRYKKHSVGDFTKYYSLDKSVRAMTTYNQRIRQKGSSNPCMINNGNCSQLCLISPTHPYHTCKCDIISVKKDNDTCVPFKCRIENGGCGMDCINIQGGLSNKCQCRNGFTLQPDNKTCTGEMGQIFLSKTSSGYVLIDTKRNVHLFTHLNISVQDITFNPIDKYMYVIQEKDKQIIKILFGEKDISGKITHEVRQRSFLDIDWLSDYIYWWNDKRVWRIKHDNHSETETELFEFTRLQTVEIDYLNGYLYISGNQQNINYLAISDTNIYCFQINTLDNSYLKPCKWNIIPVGDTLYYRIVLDRFNLRMYVIFTILDYTSKEEKLEVKNVDDQKWKTIIKAEKINPDILDLALLDGDLYASGHQSIRKINDTNGDQTAVYQRSYVGNFMTIWVDMKTINVMQPAGKDEQCPDYEKCFGLVNKWICLKPDDICDGTPLCYDNYDEFLCSLCTRECKIVSLELFCDTGSNKNIDVVKLSEFLSWESHTFSKFIDLKSFLQFDCSVTFHMETSMDHVKMFEIHSAFHFHKLRQLIMIPLFKKINTLNKIKIVGPPLLKNLTAGDLAVVENISFFYLEGSSIVSLPNLAFHGLLSLTELYLVNNQYLRSFDSKCFKNLTIIRSMSITGSQWSIVSKEQFLDQGNLTSLNLSSNMIQILEEGVFHNLVLLKLIDLRFNRIILTSKLFLQSMYLEVIYGDSFTICCIKPEGVACFASADDISSCSNLIGNRVLAAFLWILGIMALIGNFIVLVYRACVDKSVFAKSYFIFVYNLSVSDLIMAVYMLIIALHDALYDGTYVWNDFIWRNSTLCKVAGVLSMLSSEASLIFVTLISLERFLKVKFAFGNVKISRKLGLILSLITWIIACFSSLIPLVVYDDFYATSGVCIAIPLTKEIKSGMEYAVVVFLGINFLISAFIPYVLFQIYREVKISMNKVQSTQTGREIQVAKRLSIVVITDCLCWLPVGILVILSLAGIKTPSDVYSWVIVLVLPLNAAINPYIYTFSKLGTKKRSKK